MSTMKAVEVKGDKGSPEITLNPSSPKPVPKGTEILVKVHAAGVTADELTWPELWDAPVRIPGHDISGVVVELGSDYRGPLAVGDAVYSMTDVNRGLGQAEYVIQEDKEVTKKPTSLSHAQAAALPIPVLTAWEAIFDHAKLEKGKKVLITGASGAVGLILVQIAHRLANAEVVALASSQHYTTLKELGASQVVDYNTPNWEDSVSCVDLVIDTVGDAVLTKTWKTVKNNGHIITVAEPPACWEYGKGRPEELSTYPDVKWLFFIVTARSDNLAKIAALFDDGTLKPLPIQPFPVDQAVEAWEFAGQRRRQGKVVINFVPESSWKLDFD